MIDKMFNDRYEMDLSDIFWEGIKSIRQKEKEGEY